MLSLMMCLIVTLRPNCHRFPSEPGRPIPSERNNMDTRTMSDDEDLGSTAMSQGQLMLLLEIAGRITGLMTAYEVVANKHAKIAISNEIEADVERLYACIDDTKA